jgi:structural maintenance of chromosome 2
MFIEELIIDGFKSYSTRTAVGPFDRQFNAITGLNGSGKSNILDSICFVLGISNLQQVRVGNLSELVYKQGQAGISKASVTVVFNNEDKSCGPVGYEMHDRITITRQIIIGGRNRYLLNSHNVQQNQIQNLFHSVSLNVNNPHFLIMQGRITKVINMKPQETLSMIEEAAGTRMYENKKAGALKTLEKKQAKVDEINKLLSEEITPTLEKLQKERQNYMLWVSNNNEMERLQRFCIAYEYLQVQDRLQNRNKHLEEMEEALQALVSGVKQLDDRDIEIQNLIKQQTSQRDTQRSKELKKLEEEHSKLSKDVVSSESKLKNRQSDLQTQQEARKQAQGALGELRRQMESKEKVYQKEKEKWDALINQQDSFKKDIEKAQWQMSALTAGMAAQPAPDGEGEGKSLREQLLETQTRLQTLDSEQKKRSLGIANLKERIASTEQNMSKSKTEGKRLLKEKTAIEAHITERRSELQKLRFDPEGHAKLVGAVREGEAALLSLQQKFNSLRACAGQVEFNFEECKQKTKAMGRDPNSVKGVVAKLFHIQPDFSSYHRALEVVAGGRLYFIVTDTDATAKPLLEPGQLRNRVHIIPLNKVQDRTIHPNVVRQARNVMPPGGDVQWALEIVGFQKDVQAVMKFVFGGSLVCDTPETAKKVTFHPDVRVRSVTKQGDTYDPQGTLTGGSAPRGGGVLQQLQALQEVERQVHAQQSEYQKLRAQLEKNKAAATQYAALEQELKVKEHEFALMQDTISRSAHHASETAVQEAREQLASLEEALKNMPEEKKQLEKQVKLLEKEIKSLDSSREDRIQHLEEQVERLKGEAKKHAEKIEKQREKFESLNVEYEVAKGELEAQEGKDQATGQSHGDFEAETQALKDNLQKQKEAYQKLGEKLEGMRGHLKELDESLAGLAAESSANRQQREEQELEQKKRRHKIEQLQKDDKEAGNVVLRMEKEHPWIEKDKNIFGKKGTDFDFEANDYGENKKRCDELEKQQNRLSKNINKKAMVMFEKAEQEYKDLLQKRDIILNDKCKIEQVIHDLDDKKTETLRRTWVKVNKDFDSIFATLLPHANAKLEPPEGMDPSEGLEIKVAFHGAWKQSLTELSGGQRSLLALSLVLALLLFKPAPMYILDEIDSALDLSHTQNIGAMIRQHFPHSQFIIVSLKEGMFNHANVLFRTRFIDGTSTVARYAIRDADDRVAVPEKDGEPARKKMKRAGA